MELGISGKRALVCAASKGLGKACAIHLSREGAQVTITARTEAKLRETADEISAQTGNEVTIAPGDMGSEEGRAAALSVCPQPDILVCNSGGPPAGNFRDFTRDDWLAAFDGNMFSAIELIRSTVDGMMERKYGRIVNITSAAVKNPIQALALSNGMRAGLTGFVAGLSRETVRHNVTINNLLPGPFDTDRLRGSILAAMRGGDASEDEVAAKVAASNPSGRFGDPDEFGAACAFLCSQYAGFITGQNLVMDGGEYRGTL